MTHENQSPKSNAQEKTVDHSGIQGFEFPVEVFRSESTGKIIPLGKAIDNGYAKFPTGPIVLSPEANGFVTLQPDADTTPPYPDREPQANTTDSESLDGHEVDEEPARKNKLKQALFYASTGAALITALVVGGKVVADKSEKPSELDIWNQASPVATAPLTPAASPEVSTQPSSNETLGENSDLTSDDVFDIAITFYPELGYDKIKKAITGISQADLDIIREVTSGREKASKLDTILQKYGLTEATGWSGSN
jgi:hypothetical protein